LVTGDLTLRAITKGVVSFANAAAFDPILTPGLKPRGQNRTSLPKNTFHSSRDGIYIRPVAKVFRPNSAFRRGLVHGVFFS
jgi:hypothetical protein